MGVRPGVELGPMGDHKRLARWLPDDEAAQLCFEFKGSRADRAIARCLAATLPTLLLGRVPSLDGFEALQVQLRPAAQVRGQPWIIHCHQQALNQLDQLVA